MADTTPIEWTDATWSPWEGCTKVSVGPQGGCVNCYAEAMNRWLRKGENWGPGAPRRIYSSAHWDKPLLWNKAAAKAGKRMRVFPSVCDPFDNEVAPIMRARFFELIARTPNLDWLLLTKRIGNARAMLPPTVNDFAAVYPNVWLGATVVTQEEADRDIPKLLSTPARVRFLSIEPLLGPIDLTHIDKDRVWSIDALAGDYWREEEDETGFHNVERIKNVRKLDWVIVGGESGLGARPMHPDWARSLRDQCAAAGVPFLFKQWGEWKDVGSRAASPSSLPGNLCRVTTPGRPDHYVAISGDKALILSKVGKKAAGRLLDGVEHDAFPAVGST